MRRLLLALAPALALAGAACDATPKPLPCPGTVVGVFRFTAEAQDVAPGVARACPFSPRPPSFTATLAWGSDTEAILCLDRPEADPLRGPRTGASTFRISGPALTAYTSTYTSACTCTTTVTEVLSGDVVTDAAGTATHVDGTLVDAIAPSSADAVCDKPQPATPCGVPCQLQWKLTGVR